MAREVKFPKSGPRKRPTPRVKKCEICGVDFFGHTSAKYCGKKCAAIGSAAKRVSSNGVKIGTVVICEECGAFVFATNSRRKLCKSPDCQRKAQNARCRKYEQINPEQAKERGKRYRDENPDLVRARTNNWRYENPERWRGIINNWYARNPDKPREYGNRRRAAKEGADHEKYTLQEVYDACAGICYLCHDVVDLDLKYPHRGAAIVEHIHPITRGGPDKWGNIALSHSYCNLSKRKRLLAELDLPMEPFSSVALRLGL